MDQDSSLVVHTTLITQLFLQSDSQYAHNGLNVGRIIF